MRTIFIIGLCIYAAVMVYANIRLSAYESKHRKGVAHGYIKRNRDVRTNAKNLSVDFAAAENITRSSDKGGSGRSTEGIEKDPEQETIG